MDNKTVFKKYYSRLAWEGIFKALIIGLVIGFFANFIVALVTWFFDFKGLWLSIGIGLGVAAISAPILYFAKFRPTTKQIAERIDRLGYDERMITMLELEQDQSYIAMRQREDAQSKLNGVNKKDVKINIFTKAFFTPALIVAFCLSVVLGTAMTTVTGLSDADVIDPGSEIILPKPEPDKFYIVYNGKVQAIDLEEGVVLDDYIDLEEAEWELGEGGGYFRVKLQELLSYEQEDVVSGDTADNILAVGVGGMYGDWAFVIWSDGYGDPSRDDVVLDDINVIAQFIRLEDPREDNPGGGGGGGNGDENGESGSQPQDPSSGEGEGEDGDPNPGSPSSGASGGDEKNNNTILDGVTDYRDVYEGDYYQQLMAYLAENGDNLPPDLREILELYFNSLL